MLQGWELVGCLLRVNVEAFVADLLNQFTMKYRLSVSKGLWLPSAFSSLHLLQGDPATFD